MAITTQDPTEPKALERIIQLAKNEADQWGEILRGDTDVIYMNSATGETKEVQIPLKAPSVTLRDIQSLVDYLKAREEGNNSQPISIFIQPDSVVAVIDYKSDSFVHNYRCHRAKLPLLQSPFFKYCSIRHTSDPKSIVKSLRFNLRGAYCTPEVIPALSQLKFAEQATADHSNTTADEGVSRSIRAQVSGASAIPDEFRVSFEMYPSISHQLDHRGNVGIGMALTVDPSAQQICIEAFPGELEEATVEGMNYVKQAIVNQLDEAGVSHETYLGFLH